MIDYVESTVFEKDKENRFRPLSLKKSRSNALPPKHPCFENQAVHNNVPDRFDFSKDDAYSEMSVQYVPKNTKTNNDWAFNNFQAWPETRNRAFPDAQCPVDLRSRTNWTLLSNCTVGCDGCQRIPNKLP